MPAISLPVRSALSLHRCAPVSSPLSAVTLRPLEIDPTTQSLLDLWRRLAAWRRADHNRPTGLGGLLGRGPVEVVRIRAPEQQATLVKPTIAGRITVTRTPAEVSVAFVGPVVHFRPRDTGYLAALGRYPATVSVLPAPAVGDGE